MKKLKVESSKLEVTERPMLFSTPMVQGILNLLKKMTRRTKGFDSINTDPDQYEFKGLLYLEKGELGVKIAGLYAWFRVEGTETEVSPIFCPYGKPGDVLWVRESFGSFYDEDGRYIGYKADGLGDDLKFKPSIHMPKNASRIWLKIKEVRVERLLKISEVDSISEGIEEIDSPSSFYKRYKNYCNKKSTCFSGNESGFYNPTTSFLSLWGKINGVESLDSNPWVWVVEFEVLSTTGRPESISVKKEDAA